MRLEGYPGLLALRPERVRQFMRSRGWQQDPGRTRAPLVYCYRRGDAVAMVPGSGLGDFDRRLVELLEQLAEIHQRPAWQLVDEMSAPLGDILEIRIRAEAVNDGTLPLDAAGAYRQAARDLILAGAHATIEPRAHFARMTRKEPLELLARCREGQSARGSYRIRTIVPMDPQIGQTDLDPLARRTVLTIHRAATAAVTAVDQDRPEALLTLHGAGVSANLLSALAALEPPGEGEGGGVDLAVHWSHDRAPPSAAGGIVRIGRAAFGHFRSAARTIRASTPEPGVELDGYVVRLRSADPGQGGTVSILGEIEGGDTRKVTVALDGPAYGRLVDAHKSGSRVRLVGDLLQKPRSAELQHATVLEIIDEGEAVQGEAEQAANA